MSKKDIKKIQRLKNLMYTIVPMRQEELASFMMLDVLPKYYQYQDIQYIDKGGVIATGEMKVGLVAHLDTVHTLPAVDIFYDQSEDVMWSPQGIGADDRAGVALIIMLLEHLSSQGLPLPTIFLTYDEEIGCKGSSLIAGYFNEDAFDLKYMIQLDRRGHMNGVYYELENTNFEKYIESFGFNTEIGSYSDIAVLCPTFKLCGVNLSVGYYREHTAAEHLKLKEAIETYKAVIEMLYDIDACPYYKATFFSYTSKYYNGYSAYTGYSKNSYNYNYNSNKKKNKILTDGDDIIDSSNSYHKDVCKICKQTEYVNSSTHVCWQCEALEDDYSESGYHLAQCHHCGVEDWVDDYTGLCGCCEGWVSK